MVQPEGVSCVLIAFTKFLYAEVGVEGLEMAVVVDPSEHAQEAMIPMTAVLILVTMATGESSLIQKGFLEASE